MAADSAMKITRTWWVSFLFSWRKIYPAFSLQPNHNLPCLAKMWSMWEIQGPPLFWHLSLLSCLTFDGARSQHQQNWSHSPNSSTLLDLWQPGNAVHNRVLWEAIHRKTLNTVVGSESPASYTQLDGVAYFSLAKDQLSELLSLWMDDLERKSVRDSASDA